MRVAGIDGCKAGWIVVLLDERKRGDFVVVRTLAELAALGPSLAMIDMPIGLPETGYRGCDIAARRLLPKCQSRVFLGARRPLLDRMASFQDANAWAKADGKGLSVQMFNILPKIEQLDDFVRGAPLPMYETHPELVFARLNGGVPLVGKKTPAGFEARLALLQRQGLCGVESWLPRLRGSGAGRDDLLDAYACALAAFDAANGIFRRVTETPQVDRRGLAMQIHY
jgi:predicted RNase H-like nuclease